MGLSPLNEHRFKYNFIPDPNCEHCTNTPESTEYYIFKCLRYTEARKNMLSSLVNEGVDIRNLEKLLDTILHGKGYDDKHITILPTVYDYLRDTNRFK